MSEAVAATPASTGSFDSVAWNEARERTVRASREAGNTHLDAIPAYVETMRGRDIFYVHDPKVRGTIRTVDNWRNVHVHWHDQYSADSELAHESVVGGRRVFASSIGMNNLRDYALVPDRRQAQNHAETVGGTCAPNDPCDAPDTTPNTSEDTMSLLTNLLPLLGGATEVSVTLKGDASGGVSALVVSRIDPALIESKEPELAALAAALAQPIFVKAATTGEAEDAITAHLRTAAGLRAEAVSVLGEYQAALKDATEAAKKATEAAKAKAKAAAKSKTTEAPKAASAAVEPAEGVQDEGHDEGHEGDDDSADTAATAEPFSGGGLFD